MRKTSTSSLIDAIRKDDVKSVKSLIEDRDVNLAVDNNRALRWASSSGHSDIVKSLLEKSDEVDPSRGLRVAVKNGQTDVVKVLINDKRVPELIDDDLIKLAKDKEIVDMLFKKKSASQLPPTELPVPPVFHLQPRKKSLRRSKTPEQSKSNKKKRRSKSPEKIIKIIMESSDQETTSEQEVEKLQKDIFNVLKRDTLVSYIQRHGSLLGKGGESKVYSLNNVVACKIFKKNVGYDQRGRNIDFLENNKDTGVVPDLYYTEPEEWDVICMELLKDYKTLKKMLEKKDVNKAKLFKAILKARKKLPKNIFFNDFRNPENILIKESNGNIEKVKFLEGGKEDIDNNAVYNFAIEMKDKMKLTDEDFNKGVKIL